MENYGLINPIVHYHHPKPHDFVEGRYAYGKYLRRDYMVNI